jgi:Zn finger protein HypA/HybF involved in hydrogenase expression
MNREQRRKAMKEAKQQNNEELANKIALFGKVPESCLTCEEPFDKSDKKMVMSWSVVVHGEEEVVRLYCPECWNKAVRITEDFKKHLEDKYGFNEDERNT